MASLASRGWKAPSVLSSSKESFSHYGSRVISSITLSGFLYVILAIKTIHFWLIVCIWGNALSTRASIALTFVLLLDVGIAQAHQSHLEAEDSHFAIPSTKERKENETLWQFDGWISIRSWCIVTMSPCVGLALLGGTKTGEITWVKAGGICATVWNCIIAHPE